MPVLVVLAVLVALAVYGYTRQADDVASAPPQTPAPIEPPQIKPSAVGSLLSWLIIASLPAAGLYVLLVDRDGAQDLKYERETVAPVSAPPPASKKRPHASPSPTPAAPRDHGLRNPAHDQLDRIKATLGRTNEIPDTLLRHDPLLDSALAPQQPKSRSRRKGSNPGALYDSTLPTLSQDKPVSVDGYYRKDGKYVRPHTRSRPSR